MLYVMVKVYGSGRHYRHYLILIRGSLLIRKSKDMEYLYGKMEVNILVILLMIRDMDMVKCIGLMGKYIKECGRMENKLLKINILIKV